MTRLAIYPPGGLNPIFKAPITKGALIKRQLGGDYYIEVPFNHNEYKVFNRGCYIHYNNAIFFLKRRVYPESLTNAAGYKYTLKFYARQHYMQDCRVKWASDLGVEVTFDLTTTLATFAQLLVDNMNTYLGVTSWQVGTVEVDNADATQHITFDGKTCWNSAVEVAKVFGVDWWVDDNGDSVVLNFGKCEIGDVVEFVEGEIIKKMPISKRGDDSAYGTRFYIYGGTRNLPEDYYPVDQGGVTNHVSAKRLHMPADTPYIDAWADMDDADVVEQVVFLDDVYPKNTETITAVTTREVTIDGVVRRYYRIECADTAFVPSNLISPLGAVFTSGSLQGREFDLQIVGPDNDSSFEKWFEIITQTEGATEDSSVNIPNEYLHPEVGDTFVLTGVKLPDEYVEQAEVELRDKGVDLVVQYSRDTNVYDCPTNPVYCQINDKSFELGQRVKLIGDAFGDNGRTSRVQGYEKKLYNEYEATYSVGDNEIYSRYTWFGKRIIAVTESEVKLNKGQLTLEAKTQWSNTETKEEISIARLSVEKVSEELSANEKAVFAIDKRLQAVEANTGSTDLSALEAKVDTNTTNIATLVNADATLSNKISEVANIVVGHDEELAIIGKSTASLSIRVTNIENKVGVSVVSDENGDSADTLVIGEEILISK